MLGAIAGDIVGSIYEFDNVKTKQFPLFRLESRFTDDTLCTVAVADCLLHDGDPEPYLRRWAGKYLGLDYGDMFRRWLNDETKGPYNSWGNGAAMRVSPAAFLGRSLDEARANARRITVVTHNHPEGVKGALATTDAIWLARGGATSKQIANHVANEYGYDMRRSVSSIRETYAFEESCQRTVPEAIICALEARDFEDALRNAVSLGGDSDTLACIAGGIAEARFAVPKEIAQAVKARLPVDLLQVVEDMYSRRPR